MLTTKKAYRSFKRGTCKYDCGAFEVIANDDYNVTRDNTWACKRHRLPNDIKEEEEILYRAISYIS